jgi:adenylate cyclase
MLTMTKTERRPRKTEPRGASQDLKGTPGQGLEADWTRRAILANLRHELRTPLNAIIGYSEILMEDAKGQGKKDYVSDLGKIHSAANQLLALVDEILDPAKIDAAQGDLDLETFGAKLRHELRTPLNAIIGYSEMLLEDAKDRGQEDFITDLRKIHSAANRFLSLINDIVNFSKIEAGVEDQNLETIDKSGIIQDVGSAIRPLVEVEATVTPERGALLVVDDNEMNRDLLCRQLERQGHAVTVAANGRQALEIIKTQRFDLVLLDILMPEMNGYEVLQRLKSHKSWRDIPVIMISAFEEMDSVVRCIEMGAEDYLPKPFDPVLLRARISACLEKKRLRDQEIEHQQKLKELNKALEVRNRLIRATFGRYLSDEIVDSILETPEGLKLGGEKRNVTIMMADLRGFTSIGELLLPEDVVGIINIYLETMTEIILKYQGTIDEFIGDAILVVFGAPILREDDTRRAVACAIEMQLAMAGVNERIRQHGNPEVAMGIGINMGSVVVGNIGSKKRTKYGVVGSSVNLTSRIESFTVGGQILISESTLEACGPILRIDDQMEVMLKGVKAPIRIYEVGGIGGDFNLFLPEKGEIQFAELRRPLSVQYTILTGKQVREVVHDGTMVKLGAKAAEIEADVPADRLSDLKLRLFDDRGTEITGDLYAKVTEILTGSPPRFRVYFTSVSLEAESFLQRVLALMSS